MQLFDTEINEVCAILDKLPKRNLEIKDSSLENTKNNMVFSNESAFELGGNFCESLSYELTSTSNILTQDELVLIGKDLNELNRDVNFCRITLLQIKDEKLEGEKLYDSLERIKLTKYRVSPNGYMLRTATGNHEKIRVSKEFQSKYTFSDIGSSYIHAYKMLPYVNFVKEIFITGDCNAFEELKEIGNRKKEITDTIDHMLKGLVVNDCGSCSVKELCDKVEGLREIHKNL